MTQVKQFISLFLNKKFYRKTIAYGLLVLLVFVMKDFIGIFLAAFVFGYLAYSGATFIYSKLHQYSFLKPVSKILSFNIIVFLEYLLFIAIIALMLTNIFPKLIYELAELSRSMPFLSDYIETVREYLELVRNGYTEIGATFEELIISEDYTVFFDIFDSIKSAGAVFFKWLLALILSFIFIVDRQKLDNYLAGLKKSNFKFLYSEYAIIVEKVTKSFGMILKAQSMVGAINAGMTIVGLLIIWAFFGKVFPFLLTLWLLVFIFGFVPVLGVFISSIPIFFIAYSVFWISAALAVLVLIIVIHAIEAYYLNPKIISSYFQIPVSLTFIILIVSENLFWLAGLLIGVSLFYFIMGLFADMNKAIWKTQKKLESKR